MPLVAAVISISILCDAVIEAVLVLKNTICHFEMFLETETGNTMEEPLDR
jgi:hypothetical protein